jgi:hypothetical protein
MRLFTSFGNDGYDLYGEKFLTSYQKFGTLPITIYYEVKRDFPEHELISYENLFSVSALDAYLARKLVATNGGIDKMHQQYWRYNINKFCRKVFAQFVELEKGGQIAWIDADMTIRSKMDDQQIIDSLNDTYIAYLGRNNFHPCTSYVAWDCDHKDHEIFLPYYKGLYTSMGVFKLEEWHDAFVFGKTIEKLDVKTKNLAKDKRMANGSVNVFDLVFKWGRHKKGNRKYDWCKKA